MLAILSRVLVLGVGIFAASSCKNDSTTTSEKSNSTEKSVAQRPSPRASTQKEISSSSRERSETDFRAVDPPLWLLLEEDFEGALSSILTSSENTHSASVEDLVLWLQQKGHSLLSAIREAESLRENPSAYRWLILHSIKHLPASESSDDILKVFKAEILPHHPDLAIQLGSLLHQKDEDYDISELASTKPAEVMMQTLVGYLMEMGRTQPVEALEHLNKLAGEVNTDPAIFAIVDGNEFDDPTAILPWVAEVGDSEMREYLLRTVAMQFHQSNPNDFRLWLSDQSPEVQMDLEDHLDNLSTPDPREDIPGR